MLAKLLSIATIIWFYKTAKDSNENAIQWAVIGFIGFWLSAIITHYVLIDPLLAVFRGSAAMSALIGQLPAVVGISAAFLIRKVYLLKKIEKS